MNDKVKNENAILQVANPEDSTFDTVFRYLFGIKAKMQLT